MASACAKPSKPKLMPPMRQPTAKPPFNSTYRKALATTKITLELAEQDQELIAHHGVSLREAEQAKIDATHAAADSEAALQQHLPEGARHDENHSRTG